MSPFSDGGEERALDILYKPLARSESWSSGLAARIFELPLADCCPVRFFFAVSTALALHIARLMPKWRGVNSARGNAPRGYLSARAPRQYLFYTSLKRGVYNNDPGVQFETCRGPISSVAPTLQPMSAGR